MFQVVEIELIPMNKSVDTTNGKKFVCAILISNLQEIGTRLF